MIKRMALGLVISLFWITFAFAKNPIILLPGTGSKPDMFNKQCLIKTLMNAGYTNDEIGVVNFDSDNQGFIQEDVKALKQKIDEIKTNTHADKVDIIAYSRGGLVAELYTMMYGSQYEPTMKYSYTDAGGGRKNTTITNIPRYGNDVGQVIMIGTGHKGSWLGKTAYRYPKIGKIFEYLFRTPDPYALGIEQQRNDSNWTVDFSQKKLNPDVEYINIVEDRFLGGDGVFSYDSASAKDWWSGDKRPEMFRIKDSLLKPEYNPNYTPAPCVTHGSLVPNRDVKALALGAIAAHSPLTAQFSISPNSPVREGQMSINVILNASLPTPPPLFVGGNGAFSSPKKISLSGSGKNFSGSLNIPKGTDNKAVLYFENYQSKVDIPNVCQGETLSWRIPIPMNSSYLFYIDTEEPVVLSTTPKDGAVIYTDTVPINVKISAALFDPFVNGYRSDIKKESILLKTPKEWIKEETQTYNLLDYGNYFCEIQATDNANSPPHGLKPQNPHHWKFKIKDPPKAILSVFTWPWIKFYDCRDKLIATAPGGYSASWEGKCQPESENRRIEFRYGLSGLSDGYSFTTSQQENRGPGSYNFYVQPRYADDDKKEGNVVSAGVWIDEERRKPPGCDNPDDIPVVPGPVMDESIEVDFDADYCILGNGFIPMMAKLMNNLNRTFNIRHPDWILESKRYPVLIIPSGGLYGLETSGFFKESLAKYVEEGGTLICLAQQQGFDFSALPGGKVGGYGWQEDQSCWSNAVYVDEAHPIFAGQQKTQIDANVDGYFTQIPDKARVLLKRTKNQQPAMISYEYGSGTVLACTLYSDFGLLMNQTSKGEMRLIQDILSWAVQPKEEIQEYGTQTVEVKVEVEVKNDTGTSANKVIFTLIDPDRNTVATKSETIFIPSYHFSLFTFNFSLPASTLGIWCINYELADSEGNTIQPARLGNRFAISNKLGNQLVSESGFCFAVQSESEYYHYGATATFKIIIWNKTENPATITCGYWFPHYTAGKIEEITIPAQGVGSSTYPVVVTKNVDTLWAYFYNSGLWTNYIGRELRLFYGVQPKMKITLDTSKNHYLPGDEVEIRWQAKNMLSTSDTGNLGIKVYDAANTLVFGTNTMVSIKPYQSATGSYRFQLPEYALTGIYGIQANIRNDRREIVRGYGQFSLPYARAKITPILPPYFSTSTTLYFQIENIGSITILPGSLTLSPGNVPLDSSLTLTYETQVGTIAVGSITTVPVHISIANLRFTWYSLGYNYIYGRHREESAWGYIEFPCQLITKQTINKPSYKVREDIGLKVELINTGRFLEELEVEVKIDKSGYGTITGLSLLPDTTATLSYVIPLSATATAGKYDGTITARLKDGEAREGKFEFVIPEAWLEFSLPKDNFDVGEEVIGIVMNTGGVDTDFEYDVRLIDSSGREISKGSSCTGDIRPDGTESISCYIPGQAVSGDYNLIVSGTQTGGKMWGFQKLIHIQGISAEMELTTDKQNYIPAETITATAFLKNVGVENIENGTLTFKVYKNISMIHNDVVEFGFDNNGVINHASFIGGENLLDEFQVGIWGDVWPDQFLSFLSGPEFHVTNRMYDKDYYEVKGYFEHGTSKIWLTSRYKLFRDTATYLDCRYSLKLEIEVMDFRFLMISDPKKGEVEYSYIIANDSPWQMSQYVKDDWKIYPDWDWPYPLPLISAGTETKIGFITNLVGFFEQ
ncbi:MAG: hypothetical protein QME42_01965, partial [bacterium]|nr:hypothetical protein [bacterium]